MTMQGTAGAPAEATERAGRAAGGPTRVVCGVDGRRLGFEAARQAARLTDPEGRLTLVAVVETFAALSGRWGDEPSRWRLEMKRTRSPESCVAELSDRARASLAWAQSQAGNRAGS